MAEGTPLTEISPDVWSNGHLRFDPMEYREGKRPVWIMRLASSDQDAAPVGYIKWHGPWAQFVLWTVAEYVFAHDCLQDIAQFCRDRTTELQRPMV
jgi:hypothetical protein